jgi:hypothetical protein
MPTTLFRYATTYFGALSVTSNKHSTSHRYRPMGRLSEYSPIRLSKPTVGLRRVAAVLGQRIGKRVRVIARRKDRGHCRFTKSFAQTAVKSLAHCPTMFCSLIATLVANGAFL